MSELDFKPEPAHHVAGDKLITVPAMDDPAAIAAASRHGQNGRAVRRRFSVTRRAPSINDGFRPFRVF
jgi:hypothetical protein